MVFLLICEGVARLNLKGGKVDRSNAQVEAPNAPRGMGCGEAMSPLSGEGFGEDWTPVIFLLFDFKMEHCSAVF